MPDPPVPDCAAPRDWPTFRSCGVRIDAVTLAEAADLIVRGHAAGAVHLCNAYTLSLAASDPALAAVLEHGTLNVADGMPLVWIARRLGLAHMTGRVYGPDLMAQVLDTGRRHGRRHYLLGATPDVLAAVEAHMAATWPGAEISGREAPPFSADPAAFDAALAGIEAARPDVVWVGLGTPKQDLVVDRLARRAPGTYVAVGAAFDFFAGAKRQAPAWMQARGLEWSYRLATEPRRLWRRYLVGNTAFVVANARHRPHLDVRRRPGAGGG